MVFYNIRYILRKILYIIKWSIPALLTILLIVFCFFIMTSRASAYVDVNSSSNMNFYIEDTFFDFLKNSDYYNYNYTMFAWAFTYNNQLLWSAIFVPAGTYDYIADINTSTNTITWNTSISPYFKTLSNAESDFPNINSITETTSGNLGVGGWLDQSNIKVISYKNISGVNCRCFLGSANSVILNGDPSNKINFSGLPYIPSSVDNISTDVGDINSFLQNNTINENIIEDGFPSINISPVQAETLLDSLFGSLKDIFTGEVECQDLVFQFPFSNNTITFRADYMETHLPVPIITIIRALYWYVICRFILIDILRYIDRIRQGDYFMSSDTDIKTEVL